MNEIYNFLIEAKKKTYANENIEKLSKSIQIIHDAIDKIKE